MDEYDSIIDRQFSGLRVLEFSKLKYNGEKLYNCMCVRCGARVEDVREYDIRNFQVRCCEACDPHNLSGMRFGRLMVTESTGKKNWMGYYIWKCKCDCGNEIEISTNYLTSGGTRSCGCLLREITRKRCTSDLIGKQFGRLVVIRKTDKRAPNGSILWECKCTCPEGKIVEVTTGCLKQGDVKSCGCLHREHAISLAKSMAKWKTPEERKIAEAYDNMIQRCYNRNCPGYSGYGGAGIYVCDAWLDPKCGKKRFVEWSIENGFKIGLEIDRWPDKNGPYAPWNCRWVTRQENMNNIRTNVIVNVDGETHTMSEWARICKANYETFHWLHRSNQIDRLKEFIRQNRQ